MASLQEIRNDAHDSINIQKSSRTASRGEMKLTDLIKDPAKLHVRCTAKSSISGHKGEPLALDRAESSALFGPANEEVAAVPAPLAQADCGSEPAMSNESCIDVRRLSVD